LPFTDLLKEVVDLKTSLAVKQRILVELDTELVELRRRLAEAER